METHDQVKLRPTFFTLIILLNLEICRILAVKYVVNCSSCCFSLSAFSKKVRWGILWSVSEKPRVIRDVHLALISCTTFSFFPSAHLISACLPLFFIPWSYLQRNASLSISLNRSFFLSLDSITLVSSFFFVLLCFLCPGGCRPFSLYLILVRVKTGFYWKLTQTYILQQYRCLKIRTWKIIAINQITFADRIS